MIRVLEAIPPLGKARQLGANFTAHTTQPKEIVTRTKAWVLEQPVGALTGALLKARLQRPCFFDRRFEAPRDRQAFGLLLEHAVHRFEQRGYGPLTFRLRRVPRRQHLMP